jgi:hypothetical protein
LVVPEGVLINDTDMKTLFMGDGSVQGGIPVTNHGRFNEVDNQKRDHACICILQR